MTRTACQQFVGNDMGRTIARYLSAVLAVAGVASYAWADAFRVIALPDTQCYSRYYPAIFTAQTNWIKANVDDLSIAFVTHLGDITDLGFQTYMWDNARQAMQILNGVVPYGLCPGNHDILNASGAYDCTNFVTYFGPSCFQGCSWYGGASPSGFSSWQKITAGGYELMFIHLTVDAPYPEITWAQSVISANKGVPTIVTTHDYLNTTSRAQTPCIFGRNSAETVWNNLIRCNDQIFAVLCGHISGEKIQTSIDNAGRKVYEMLSDYQSEPNGGNGWLRIITFDRQAGTIAVQTYSPKLDQYRTDSRNQFTISLDTDRFAPEVMPKLMRPQVISDFNTGDTRDGWIRNNCNDGYTGPNPQGDPASTLVRKSDADGRGYLYYTEAAGGQQDHFVAPAEFLGDLSHYDAIYFDHRVFTAGGTPSPTHLRLYRGSQYYEWLNTERVFNNGQWQRLVASLTDPDLWTPAGSALDLKSFIKNITEIRVCADILPGTEVIGLDNFALANYDTILSCPAVSTFDSDADGWTATAGGAPGFDVHGFATGTDLSTAAHWYFKAPARFLGNKSACYGAELQYDLRQNKVDSQCDDDEVELSGAGMTLSMDLPSTGHPDTTWTHYSFRLDENAGWTDRSTGLPPTESEFLSVLCALTGLRIRGEFRQGANTAYLDNVAMGPDIAPVIIPPDLPLSEIADINSAGDGSAVSITSAKAVTVASNTFTDGSFYIEEPNRFCGVKVIPAPGLQPVAVGDRITGNGVTATDANGERYVSLSSVSVAAGSPLGPLAMSNKAIAKGIRPSGLLLKVWGKVVYTDPVTPPDKPGYVYIDDGYRASFGSHKGIRVILDGLISPITRDLEGARVLVTGVLGTAWDGATLKPVIRPRGDSDITVF